jgi:hypothetical protein
VARGLGAAGILGDFAMARRIDPDPITIYMAIVATYSASVATVNYLKTHYKQLPTKSRAKLVVSLAKLGEHTKGMREDAKTIRGIFQNAKFAAGRKIRLGNGAELTQRDFSRFEKTSDNVLRRLRKVHKLCLKMERETAKLGTLETGQITNVLGETYRRLQRLLESRDLSFEKAWAELDAIAEGLERAIADLRKQLDPD